MRHNHHRHLRGKTNHQIDAVINDFPEPQDILNPPANSYDRTYVQKGVFPGDNVVVATATDEDGNTFVKIQKWNA